MTHPDSHGPVVQSTTPASMLIVRIQHWAGNLKHWEPMAKQKLATTDGCCYIIVANLTLHFVFLLVFSDCHSHFPRGMARVHVDLKFYAQFLFAMRVSAPRFSSAHGANCFHRSRVPRHPTSPTTHPQTWEFLSRPINLAFSWGLSHPVLEKWHVQQWCAPTICWHYHTLPNWHLPVQCLWQPGSSAHARLVLWTIPRYETRNSLDQRPLSMKMQIFEIIV